MPLFAIVRSVTAILSLAVLAAAGYLLWTWNQGDWVRDPAGELARVREDWRLWTGLALLAWSFLGGRILPFLLARPDRGDHDWSRGQGRTLQGASGASLYVETHGPAEGPPIVFTHGWGMDSTFWAQARRDLGDRFRLVFWDLPGLGLSKPGAGGVGLEAFAEDLATLLEATGRRPAVLVGHSIGGMTIQTLVRDRPELADRIAGVVLLDTTHTNPLRTMILSRLMLALQKPLLEPMMRLAVWLQPLVWLSNWQSYLSGSTHLAMRLGFGRFVTRGQLRHVALLTTRNPPGVQARGNLAMMRWDATGAVGRLRAPLLVIAGDKDIVTKLEANRAIAQDSPNGELKVAEGANHMGPMERADLYNELIADFALRVQPSATLDVRPPTRAGDGLDRSGREADGGVWTPAGP